MHYHDGSPPHLPLTSNILLVSQVPQIPQVSLVPQVPLVSLVFLVSLVPLLLFPLVALAYI